MAKHQLAARPSKFLTDDRTQARVRHDDYTRSGFDRGHMAPNSAIGQCYGDEAQRETFYLSNIVPQKPALNQQFWRLLEERMETDYAVRFEDVWVTTGPLYDSTWQNLAAGVEIPDAFFQITVDEESGRPRVLAFVVPQVVDGKEPLSDFLTSIDAVEKLSGLDFLAVLPDALESSVESNRPTEVW